ncbi:hypothetical protein HWV62_44279 [Athelia sp. TMB]|nr:hypothetical protein HWV62_44279 [Athelia sp. TMB]
MGTVPNRCKSCGNMGYFTQMCCQDWCRVHKSGCDDTRQRQFEALEHKEREQLEDEARRAAEEAGGVYHPPAMATQDTGPQAAASQDHYPPPLVPHRYTVPRNTFRMEPRHIEHAVIGHPTIPRLTLQDILRNQHWNTRQRVPRPRVHALRPPATQNRYPHPIPHIARPWPQYPLAEQPPERESSEDSYTHRIPAGMTARAYGKK